MVQLVIGYWKHVHGTVGWWSNPRDTALLVNRPVAAETTAEQEQSGTEEEKTDSCPLPKKTLNFKVVGMLRGNPFWLLKFVLNCGSEKIPSHLN